MIREVNYDDFQGMLELYTQLHDNPFPDINADLLTTWKKIVTDENHHIIVAEKNGQIVSSCVLVIIPNLTHSQRPYAFIENVITDILFRKQGLASACLEYAKQIAIQNNCYKIMLLTGSKQENTLVFYEQCGYNRNDKTAFIQWLNP